MHVFCFFAFECKSSSITEFLPETRLHAQALKAGKKQTGWILRLKENELTIKGAFHLLLWETSTTALPSSRGQTAPDNGNYKKKKTIRWTFSNILSFLHKKQYQKIVKCIFFGCCNTSLCKYMSACMQMHTAFHRICSLGTYKRTNLCALHYFAIIHLGLISSSLPNPLFSALAHTSTRVQHKAGSIFGW